jgi:solute carrier family 25 2-oxodicarboxylate transporter 21
MSNNSSQKSTPSPPHHLPFHIHVFAGASAGLVEVLIMYPLDVVKTRLQLQHGTGKYTSVVQTFKTIIAEEGFGNLYRGIVSPILAEAPKRAIKFSSNEQYKRFLSDSKGKVTTFGASIAGAGAGITEAFINCPFEVVKVRLQSPDALSLYKNTFDAAVKIGSQEGPLALYKGLEAQLIRNAVWNAAYFGTINYCKSIMWTPKNKGSESFRNFLAGFIAGTVGTTLNTPFDVVKSRVQNTRTGQMPWTIPKLIEIFKQEGFKALFKGYVPRILRLGPGGGIMLLAFDFIVGLLH